MAKTDCREVIEALEAFLNAPEARRSDIEGALAHLRTCPACRGRAGHLARLLAAGAADEDVLTCGECEELLPGFLAVERLGGDGTDAWIDVRRHLAVCPHCADVLVSLAGLARLGFAEAGAEPPRIPEPDLSSLRNREPSGGRASPAPERTEPAADETCRQPRVLSGSFNEDRRLRRGSKSPRVSTGWPP